MHRALKIIIWSIVGLILSPFILALLALLIAAIIALCGLLLFGGIAAFFVIQFIIALIIGLIMFRVSSNPCSLALITKNLCIADTKNAFMILTFETFIWEHIVIAIIIILILIIGGCIFCTSFSIYKIEECERNQKRHKSTEVYSLPSITEISRKVVEV